MKPVIRDLENGDFVVDFGAKWFRFFQNGRIIKKHARKGTIEKTEASPDERNLVMKHLARFWFANF